MYVPNELVEKISILGLSSYEAKTYVALIMLGSGAGADIAKVAKIPETSVYRALDKLLRRGWIVVARGRPTIYSAIDPEIVKKQVIDEISRLFDKLKEIHRSIEAEERPEIIYTIFGEKRVLAKIFEVINGAREFIILSAPSEVIIKIVEKIEERKDIPIRIISDKEVMFRNKNIRLRIYSPLLVLDLLVDNNQSLISMPDFSVCGWVSNPLIAKHFGQFLEMRWKLSKETNI